MKEIDRKIIDAVIEKARRVCPESLALIGVYGSVATGDEHERSDLDLLILVKDEKGGQLATCFILEENQVGYDLYCTDRAGLWADSECHHAQLSKLMRSRIVYVGDQQAYEELLRLREKTEAFLRSEQRFDRVADLISKAKESFADLYLYDDLGAVRKGAFGVICRVLDAVMLACGDYYKRGTKRVFEELAEKGLDGTLAENIRQIAKSRDIGEIRECAKRILTYTQEYAQNKRPRTEVHGGPADELVGTYEEMFSNWRNKAEEAAKKQDVFASFMSMSGFQCMISEILSSLAMADMNIMGEYDPEHLEKNVALYDRCLAEYQKIYQKAGISVKRYRNADEFVADYLG